MKDPRKPSAAVSVLIFLVTTGVMAWLRLVVYRHQTLSLGSALPLALCLWHRDRRLLVAMAVACSLAASAQTFEFVRSWPSHAYSFYYPAAVAVDSAGNVLVGCYSSNRIQKISPSRWTMSARS